MVLIGPMLARPFCGAFPSVPLRVSPGREAAVPTAKDPASNVAFKAVSEAITYDAEEAGPDSGGEKLAPTLGFGLGFLELALLVPVRLVAEAHAEDRAGHANDEGDDVPMRLILPGPGDGSEKENADDRAEVAEAFPVDAQHDGLRNRFMTHTREEHPTACVGFDAEFKPGS
jgi:hypothetical protein